MNSFKTHFYVENFSFKHLYSNRVSIGLFWLFSFSTVPLTLFVERLVLFVPCSLVSVALTHLFILYNVGFGGIHGGF